MPKTITRGNWSLRDPGDAIGEGDIITGGNFSQLVPQTEILDDISDLTIRGGNWVNVKRQPTWTVEGGNWAQLSRCAHLHPDWGLAAEPDNCPHVIEIDTITIDGQVVDTIYHRQDTVV